MNGIQLKLYMQESKMHKGIPLYEWLLEKAKKFGIKGGSVFRATAGYGRHGVIHEEHFFELGPDVPMEAVFFLSQEECDIYLSMLADESLNILFVKIPVEYGLSNAQI